jgi:hypothetical protein
LGIGSASDANARDVRVDAVVAHRSGSVRDNGVGCEEKAL